jgi:2-polyprenyl-3-methyl-5-hydroxy-6-metoxy-1,4-benzoquinol methylase
MAERAHPDLPGFKDKWFGLKKSKYKSNLYRRYEFCNKYIMDKVILDIPCGTGWGTSLLKNAKMIYAVDIAPEAIEYATEHFRMKNVVYELGDMLSLRFDSGFFDAIVCLEGFEHVPRETGLKFLDEASRTLKKDGLLIMTVPILTTGKHSGNPYHLYEPSLEELQETLTQRFSFVFFETIDGPESQIVYFVGKTK